MAGSDLSPEDVFSTRGVELPNHLSTKVGRWKSFLIVLIMSVIASGPLLSFPTLEPLLISAGVFAGPNQVSDLTSMYSITVSCSMFATFFGGIAYDAVGPRITAAGCCFATVAGLVGIAIGIQFRSLNFLLWICFPWTTTFGSMNNLGAYAWLYILPDSQNTVSALVGAIQCLSDSLILFAVLLHDKFGLSLPFFFTVCALVAVISGIVCLTMIPDQALYREIVFAATKPGVDVEDNSYGAADSSVKKKAETFWDAVSRTSAAFRDCWVCYLCVCPGSFFTFAFAFMCCMYMFSISQILYMYPFYQALLGSVSATALVNVFGGLYSVTGAIVVVLFGRFADYIGFQASIVLITVPIILNFVCLCMPSFTAQVIAQELLSLLANSTWVLGPRWCLSYAPPELYGTAYGIYALIQAAFQLVGTPFGTLASGFIDNLVAPYLPPVIQYLTLIGLWFVLTMISCLSYLLLIQYYPVPAPGETTMAEIVKYTKGGKEYAEAEHVARKTWNNHEVPAANKEAVQTYSTPACAPCDCLRLPLGSRASR